MSNIPEYRAWDKEEKIMCDVSVISFGKGCSLIGNAPMEASIQGNYVVQKLPGQNNGHFCKFEDIVLMQYTGLNDIKNNRKIFEGDLVKFYSKHWIYKKRLLVREVKFNSWGSWNIMGLEVVEIIGNKFQNPELSEEV